MLSENALNMRGKQPLPIGFGRNKVEISMDWNKGLTSRVNPFFVRKTAAEPRCSATSYAVATRLFL